MTYPISHKTVFVLDHGPDFSASCQQSMEFDIFTKTRQPGIIPLSPISKSLWTCSVEAAMEYCRIVWDIFPKGKLIRFIVSDINAQTLNSWSQENQNLAHLMAALAHVGVPQTIRSRRDCPIITGLSAAIEAICECSEIQHEKRTSLTESADKVMNRGRIICITQFKSDEEISLLEEAFEQALIQQNKVAASSDSLMVIHHCELVILHVHPVNKESVINLKPKHSLSMMITNEVHPVKSGRNLAAKLGILVQQHYNLASTTVTGIPMKEEQNANSSANYDVELLHPACAHAEVFKTGVVSPEGVQQTTMKEGQVYETVTLKWCTPRSSSVELQYCTSAFRITPVDVNSRPSSCLSNFLLNGRAVMLEMPRKTGSKVLSHMLASHGGEIFIHTLGTGRSILEDPPSISEGSGGRVTDYRINDFGEFMKQNKLVPYPKSWIDEDDLPIEKAKTKLLRLTQYWPMVISHTTIFNMTSQLSPLLSLITKEVLTQDEVVECKKVIYNLVAFETKGASLPVPTVGTRGKGPKREEQYKLMWNELEAFIRCHCLTTEHRNVLDCLIDCRKPNSEGEGIASIASVKLQLGVPGATNPGIVKKTEKTYLPDEKMDTWKFSETDELKRELYIPKANDNQDEGSLKTSPVKKAKIASESIKTKGMSLLEFWTNRIDSHHAKHHVEFQGRLAGCDGPSTLYPNIKNNDTANES